MGQAFVDNQTLLENGPVEAVVRWTLELTDLNVHALGVRVHGTLSPKHDGTMYPHVQSAFPEQLDGGMPLPPAVLHLIVVYVPYIPIGKWTAAEVKGAPTLEPRTWMESLVCITAHEAYHVAELIGGDEQTYDEFGAEWAEERALTAFRERKVIT